MTSIILRTLNNDESVIRNEKFVCITRNPMPGYTFSTCFGAPGSKRH